MNDYENRPYQVFIQELKQEKAAFVLAQQQIREQINVLEKQSHQITVMLSAIEKVTLRLARQIAQCP